MEEAPGPSRVQIRHVDAGGVDAELIWPARLHHPIGGAPFFMFTGRLLQRFAGYAPCPGRIACQGYVGGRPPDRLSAGAGYPYPAQIDDTLTAYGWLLDSGYENDNIVIVGDSTGGNLAIEAVLRQMQLKGPLPAAVIAMSPITDLSATDKTTETNEAGDPVLGILALDAASKRYLKGLSPKDPRGFTYYADMAGASAVAGAGRDLRCLGGTTRCISPTRRAWRAST